MDRDQISSIVDSAFKSLSGFVETATLSTERASGFDFGAKDITSSSVSSEIDIIFLEEEENADDSPIHKYVAKSSEISPLSNYSHLTIRGYLYRIEKATDYDAIVLLELRSESI